MPMHPERTDEIDVRPLLTLFNFRSKRDVVQHCRGLVISQISFVSLIRGAQLGAIQPYRYANRFIQEVGDHLNPKEDELAALGDSKIGPLEGKAFKAVRKVRQLFAERRIFAAHLFFTPSRRYWHLFCFDNRDLGNLNERPNHWKHGAHIHFVNDLFTTLTLEEVWSRVLRGETAFLKAVHIRYRQFRNLEPG